MEFYKKADRFEVNRKITVWSFFRMPFSKAFAVPVLIFILSLMSCDDFLLKKSVSVSFLEGEIKYDPSNLNLSGNLIYTIENRQNKNLQEIFFISHASVIVDSIKYNGELVNFEIGIGYGSGIYRIRIRTLQSGSTAKIGIKFHINGPINEDRFILNEDTVFMDAKKIWLPVPFADSPSFMYSIKLTVPENYFSVLGGKNTEETIKNEEKSSVWISESTDVLHTGNLFIGLFDREQKGNTIIYSSDTNNNYLLFDYTEKTIDFLTNRFGFYPYSQIHIVNKLFQYNDIEGIEGENMANTIQLSPDLTADNLIDVQTLSSSSIPYCPRNSYSKLFEVLAHELSHAYIPHVLKFNENDYIESESITEYMALAVIAAYYPEIYNKMILRNRTDLINLMLAGQSGQNVYKYVYGVNLLHTIFGDKREEFFNYINLLIQKYEYIEIGMDELLQTARDMQDSENSNFIDSDALTLWPAGKLYNIVLTATNMVITNFLRRGFSLDMKKLITLSNDFPISLEVSLVETFPDNIITNLLKIDKNSSTNLIITSNLKSIEAISGKESIENDLSFSRIDFDTNLSGPTILDAVNEFYNNQKFTNRNIKINKDNETEIPFILLSQDRDKSNVKNSDVRFQFDCQSENSDQLYVQAYKLIGGKPYSYVLFQVKKDGKNYTVAGIMDPIF